MFYEGRTSPAIALSVCALTIISDVSRVAVFRRRGSVTATKTVRRVKMSPIRAAILTFILASPPTSSATTANVSPVVGAVTTTMTAGTGQMKGDAFRAIAASQNSDVVTVVVSEDLYVVTENLIVMIAAMRLIATRPAVTANSSALVPSSASFPTGGATEMLTALTDRMKCIVTPLVHRMNSRAVTESAHHSCGDVMATRTAAMVRTSSLACAPS
jgi:hypothetical protein